LSSEQKLVVQPLLNIIEELYSFALEAQKEISDLKDEIRRLKGEQGKPDIRPSKKDNGNNQISSESERKNLASQDSLRKTSRRRRQLEFHDEKKCVIDKSTLPADAVFKGHSKKIYQGVQTKLHNMLVTREIYYSPSEHKTYMAALPSGYDSNSYTPELKAMIIHFKHALGMTEPKILEYLTEQGIEISTGSVSNILMNESKKFIFEQEEIFDAGLQSSIYQQTDTTSARENGVNKQVHIVCTENYTVFFTEDKKDRKTVLDVLRNHRARVFRLNEEAFSLMLQLQISQSSIEQMKKFKSDISLNESEIEMILSNCKNGSHRQKIYECSYIAGYHSEGFGKVIPILLTDDAAAYNLIANHHSLCWIHEGRHYKVLSPLLLSNRQLLDDFIEQFWNFYHCLLDFKLEPSTQYAHLLQIKFQSLFECKTGYDELDNRIKKSLANKDQLLLVLKFPSLPLHNNESELGARVIVRQRDISFQTKSYQGSKARDAYLSVIHTAKKLKVNVYKYILSVINKSLIQTQSLAYTILSTAIHPP
jgi:Transposase IS66 family